MGPIVGFDYDFSLAAVKSVGFRQKIRPLVRPGGFFSCDIIEVMSRVLVSLEGRITGRGLDVDAQFPEDPIMVWGDPDAVTQVCYNLLDNAAKFAAQGTDITVQITKKDGKALVTVRNLGATIPPDELPLLFERFHKADYSRSVDREGVGLGLYIVKTILGNLKENITATSEDGVTQFTFTLTLA